MIDPDAWIDPDEDTPGTPPRPGDPVEETTPKKKKKKNGKKKKGSSKHTRKKLEAEVDEEDDIPQEQQQRSQEDGRADRKFEAGMKFSIQQVNVSAEFSARQCSWTKLAHCDQSSSFFCDCSIPAGKP